jgi:uncharacterized OB-fold protein
MVTITDYKTMTNENGKSFNLLVVQGGLESVKSKNTGKTYFTAKTANVSCTFEEEMCKTLIGQQIDGSVNKVSVDPYEYTVPETGEILTLTHRYQYVDEHDTVIQEHVAKEGVVF